MKPIDYHAKYLKYHSSEIAKKRRAERNHVRREMIKKYGKEYMKGKDVDHENTNPGGHLSNDASNIKIISSHENKSKDANSWRKTKKRNY